MKIKRGINYALVIAGALLLFTASYLEHPEVGLAMGFAFLMAGIYRLSLRTGKSLKQLSEKQADE